MRVVFDTNILISAMINPYGKPAFLLRLVLLGKIKLIFSEEILEEVVEVFSRDKIRRILKKKGIESGEVQIALENLFSISGFTEVVSKGRIVPKDSSDDKFLHCAFWGKADFIISGDQHLLELEVFEGIKIVNPDDFFRMVDVW